jgi:hypothetical protein
MGTTALIELTKYKANLTSKSYKYISWLCAQAQLAALQAVNVSALSEDDSADHDQDIMVVQMLLDDEEAYIASVRSYLPLPAQVRAEAHMLQDC